MKRLLLTFVSVLVFCTYVFPQFPGITINPSYLTGRLLPGNDTTVATQLINTSAEEITFSFSGFTSRGSGGPDTYGYSWIDSDEDGFDYNWTEISASGTEITGLTDDNTVGPFDIGFDFSYYGQMQNQFWINSNGVLKFDAGYLSFANLPLPTNESLYTNFIAMLWDDLNLQNDESKVYYQLFTDKLVIQFEKAHHYIGGFATFQLALMTDGSIMFSFREISPDFDPLTNTIGLQSPDETAGLQVSYNEDYIHNELSVLFTTQAETGDFVVAVNPASGVVPANSNVDITLTYSAAGYETGRYQQTVICTTSNPDFDTLPVYNLMIVSALPRFYGTVTDAESGAVLQGVSVTAGQYAAITGPLGQYDMEVTPGTYDIQFELQGYDPAVQSGFSINLDQLIEVSQALTLDDEFILGGTAFAGIFQLDLGYVNAFKTIGNQVVDIFADLIDTLGYYNFPVLTTGDYRVKAEPAFGSTFEGEYLPTYYGDVVHWADAQVISLTQNLFNADIHLVAATLNNSNGPGKISGTIYHSEEAKGNSTVPAPDIPIFLKKGNDHAMALSNSAGYFEFTNLDYGTYTMFAELFGKNSEFRNIILSQSNEFSETNTLFIYDTDILYNINDNLPEGIHSVSQPYPNPSTSRTTIAINLLQPMTLKLELFNVLGQSHLNQLHNLNTGMNELIIPLSDLKPGIYWLQICDENGSGIVRKLIKN